MSVIRLLKIMLACNFEELKEYCHIELILFPSTYLCEWSFTEILAIKTNRDGWWTCIRLPIRNIYPMAYLHTSLGHPDFESLMNRTLGYNRRKFSWADNLSLSASMCWLDKKDIICWKIWSFSYRHVEANGIF